MIMYKITVHLLKIWLNHLFIFPLLWCSYILPDNGGVQWGSPDLDDGLGLLPQPEVTLVINKGGPEKTQQHQVMSFV